MNLIDWIRQFDTVVLGVTLVVAVLTVIAVLAAVALLIWVLCNQPWKRDRRIELKARLEAHEDNLSPVVGPRPSIIQIIHWEEQRPLNWAGRPQTKDLFKELSSVSELYRKGVQDGDEEFWSGIESLQTRIWGFLKDAEFGPEFAEKRNEVINNTRRDVLDNRGRYRNSLCTKLSKGTSTLWSRIFRGG